MKKFPTKQLCRAGIIAALYVALTYAFAPVAFGVFQIRPGEALTLLPLFFPEAIPALYVGCILANLASPFLVYDLTIGPLATLAAAVCTYFIGVAFRKYAGKGGAALKIGLGGIFPILFNAFVIPAVIVFLCSEGADATIGAYWLTFASFLLTETVWVIGLGTPVYFFVTGMQKKGVSVFLNGDKKKKSAPAADAAQAQTQVQADDPSGPAHPTPQA